MRIFILVNTLQNVPSFVYSNHIHFFVESAKTHPEIEFKFFTPHRMSIDNARNNAALMALRSECDYLMFLDDDVLIPSNTLDLMLKSDKDVVAGLVVIRGFPFNIMAFKFEDLKEGQDPAKRKLDYYNEIPLKKPCEVGHETYRLDCQSCIAKVELQELVKVDAVGFSCCLIKTDVLKPLEPPYFMTTAWHTEDIYFCMKLRDLEPRPEIFMHTGVKCGHLLNPEPIEFANRPLMHAMYQPLKEKEFKRDNEWLDHVLKDMKGRNGN